MFASPQSDRLSRPTGKLLRPQRASLNSNFTSAEVQRRSRDGRRQVWPMNEHHRDLLVKPQTPARRSPSPQRGYATPPPYGVGAGSPATRHTGRKQTTMSAVVAHGSFKLTDDVEMGPTGRLRSASPNRRAAHAPVDNLVSVFVPPRSGPQKATGRSRSTPPVSVEQMHHPSQKATSPLKTVSKISTDCGALAGEDTRWSRPGMRINQELKHAQHFAVSAQSHAKLVERRSRSASPGRTNGPPIYASKRQYGQGVFSGEGAADAMNRWAVPHSPQFAKKKIHHQRSDAVHNVLSGRDNPLPSRGRKGVIGHNLTYRSHSVTVPEALPHSPHTPSRGRTSVAHWDHTPLW